jgi:hypothetical protein
MPFCESQRQGQAVDFVAMKRIFQGALWELPRKGEGMDVLALKRALNISNNSNVTGGGGSPVPCYWRNGGGVEVIALPLLNLGARWRWVINTATVTLFPGKRLCAH